MMSEAVFALEQKSLFAGERRFQLKEGRYLFIEQHGLRQHREYELDVLALDPKPRFRIIVTWRWIVLAALVLALEYPVLRYLLPSLDPDGQYALTVIIVFTLLAFIFIVMAFAWSYRETIFVSRHAHWPLVHLLHNRPDKARFRAFVEALREAIEHSNEQASLTRQQLLAGEIKTLRRLSRKGVLSGADYERLRLKLMKMTDE